MSVLSIIRKQKQGSFPSGVEPPDSASGLALLPIETCDHGVPKWGYCRICSVDWPNLRTGRMPYEPPRAA